jgi:hypothetical protein
MRRRLFTLLSALSLVLCLATCAEWVRSLWRCDLVNWGGQESSAIVASAGNSVLFMRLETPPLARGFGFTTKGEFALSIWNICLVSGRTSCEWEMPGIVYFEVKKPVGVAAAMVDYWLIVVTLAIFPACWTLIRLRQNLKRRRCPTPVCPACGYDLRATPDRCPECGTVPLSSK